MAALLKFVSPFVFHILHTFSSSSLPFYQRFFFVLFIQIVFICTLPIHSSFVFQVHHSFSYCSNLCCFSSPSPILNTNVYCLSSHSTSAVQPSIINFLYFVTPYPHPIFFYTLIYMIFGRIILCSLLVYIYRHTSFFHNHYKQSILTAFSHISPFTS